ncbi:hypothetical protein EJB05_37876, partial [Eragrostis curvula]
MTATSPSTAPAHPEPRSSIQTGPRNPTFPQPSPSAAFDLDGNDHPPAILDVYAYHAGLLHLSVML